MSRAELEAAGAELVEALEKVSPGVRIIVHPPH